MPTAHTIPIAETSESSDAASGDPEPSRSTPDEPAAERSRHGSSTPAPESIDRSPVDLHDETRSLSRAEMDQLRADAAAAVVALDAHGEVRVRLIDDTEMTGAHEAHCGVEGTTDVITFDLSAGAAEAGRVLDTDLLVCVDEARRQADARGHDLGRELLLYVLHGVLHCLGHTDTDPDAYARMHAREDEILEQIGVGSTFDRLDDQGGAR